MNSATSQHSTSQNVSIDAQQEKKVCFPVRYRIAAMAFAGMTIEHAIRMSVAVSVVAMVNSTSSSQSTEYNNDYTCPADGATANSTLNANSGGKFNWNSQEQALVLGAFNYGYVFSLFPGALLAAKFGGRKMFIIALLITGFLNLLGPILAETNVILLIISRALTGIGGGFTFPAIHSLLGKWAPPFERSKMSSVIYTGVNAGCTIGTLATGALSDSDFLGGWPSSFYLFGGISLLWCILALFVLFDSPEDHPRISEEEKRYIQINIGVKVEKARPPIPWKDIVTCVPLYAIAAAQFGETWLYFLVAAEMPTFFNTIYHVDISTTSIICAIPFILSLFSTCIFGWIADFLQEKGILSTTNTRKLFQIISQVGIIILSFCVYFMGCNYLATVLLFIVGVGLNSAFLIGYMSNHIDLSPTFAGTLFGLVSGFGNLGGIISPLVNGALLSGNATRQQWGNVYLLNGCICVASSIIYIIFGSAVQRTWDRPLEDDKREVIEDPAEKVAYPDLFREKERRAVGY